MVKTPQDFRNSWYTVRGGKKTEHSINKKRRKPGTWPTISVGRGPDKATQWAGPTFTLKDRSKAASRGSKYEDLYSSFNRLRPKIEVYGPRTQAVRRFLTKDMKDGHILFISREVFIWVYEQVEGGQRMLSASITYNSLALALNAYSNNSIVYKEHTSIPIADQP